jgi:hypothetical protein
MISDCTIPRALIVFMVVFSPMILFSDLLSKIPPPLPLLRTPIFFDIREVGFSLQVDLALLPRTPILFSIREVVLSLRLPYLDLPLLPRTPLLL